MHLDLIDLTNEEYISYFKSEYYSCVYIQFSDTDIQIDISDFNKLIKSIIKNEKDIFSKTQEKDMER